jgi:hypothetical protein
MMADRRAMATDRRRPRRNAKLATTKINTPGAENTDTSAPQDNKASTGDERFDRKPGARLASAAQCIALAVGRSAPHLSRVT